MVGDAYPPDGSNFSANAGSGLDANQHPCLDSAQQTAMRRLAQKIGLRAIAR